MAGTRSTLPGDIVVLHLQGRAAACARIEDVRPQGRPGWFLCDLLVLAIPPQPATWILDRSQIDGAEFTMGGEPVRLERLPDPGTLHEGLRAAEAARGGAAGDEPAAAAPGEGEPAPGAPARAGNVVRLFPRR